MLAYLVTFELPALRFALRHSFRRSFRHPFRDGRAATRAEAEPELARLLARLFGEGFRQAGLRVTVDGECPPVPPGRPVILVARHAGVLNGLVLLYVACCLLGRSPKGVCKRVMVAVPGLGALLRPLLVPFRADPAGRAFALRTLMRLAAGLGPGEALCLYPEGTGLTARRRAAALAVLAHGKHGAHPKHGAADYARLRHLLPPQAAGAAAVLAGAPDADVIVIGHTGLEDLLGPFIPIGYPLRDNGELRFKFWRIPAEQVPRRRVEVEPWLLDWWQRLDEWIAGTRAEPAVAGQEGH